jgi:hypothetical protein
MQPSTGVADGLLAFYAAFNTGDPERFADRIAASEAVSVIGSAPGEGHTGREAWVATYDAGIAAAGIRLESGGSARGFADGPSGFALDQPSFVLPDGRRLRTRLTAVLIEADDEWKIVHMHFSVGVPDEVAIEMPASG